MTLSAAQPERVPLTKRITMSPMGESSAVILGAGIAGLSATQAISTRFGCVLIVERDVLPSEPMPRRGVPQGRHPHVILAAGQAALARLFPGVREELVTAGAIPFEPGMDALVYRYGSVWPKVDTGLPLVSCTRPLLEQVLRERVSGLPNVTIRDGLTCVGLVRGADGVVGVRLDTGETIGASLVVDATGRSRASDRWLETVGFTTPSSVEVTVRVGYATRMFRRVPRLLPDGLGLLVLPTPPDQKSVGLILPVEGERWQVTIGGWHGAFPGAESEFQRFAQCLPHDGVAEVIEKGEPTTGFATQAFPSSRRRLFEKLRRVPAGYVTLGDSICSFNPIYGQGVTCAVLSALALGGTLATHGDPTSAMAREFYRRAARIIRTPWWFATGGDFLFRETTGPKPIGIDFLNAYATRVQIASKQDSDVWRTFLGVQHLMRSPIALFTPPMVLKVLRASSGLMT